MMKTKKILTLLLIICMVSALSIMTACSNTKKQTEDLSTKLNSKLDAYKTDLQDSASTMNTNANIKSYLTSWAESKGISYTTDSAGNVIMTVKAGKDYKSAAPTVILCPYDKNQFSNYINPIAMALYTVKNNENTGKLTVIFTQEAGHDFSGVKSLSSKYFTDDSNVFCLNGGQKGLFALKSGASSTYTFTEAVDHKTPSYTKAYKITITGLPGGQPDSKISKVVNPITKLESLLASLKSSSIGYELASFNGGNDSTLYAKSASITIVVDADKETSFKDKMDSQTQKFNEKNKDDLPGAKYSYKAVAMPSSVLTTESCSKFVSFMYTLFDGVYHGSNNSDNNNDETMAINSIGTIRTTDTSIVINSVAYSLDKATLSEIDSGNKTLCSLSDVSYKKTGSIDLWTGKSNSAFAKAVSDAYDKYTSQALTYTDSVTSSSASFIKQKNKKCNIMCITVNDNVVKDCTGTLVTFLQNSNSTSK